MLKGCNENGKLFYIIFKYYYKVVINERKKNYKHNVNEERLAFLLKI